MKTRARKAPSAVPREEFVRLWHEGVTLEGMAARLGISRHDVSAIASEMGLRRCIPRDERLSEIRDEFVRMWRDPSLSKRDVGRRFGVAKATTAKWARVLGLGEKACSEPDRSGIPPGDPTPEEIEELAAYAIARRIMEHRFDFDAGDIVGPRMPGGVCP